MNRSPSRLRSVRHALAGIATLVRTQPNARIHLVVTLIVIAAGIACSLTALEWCVIVFAIIGVWVAEGLNTSLEFLADAVHPERHPLVGHSKDVAAGAVLIAALGAVAIGLLVFGPKLLALAGISP